MNTTKVDSTKVGEIRRRSAVSVRCRRSSSLSRKDPRTVWQKSTWRQPWFLLCGPLCNVARQCAASQSEKSVICEGQTPYPCTTFFTLCEGWLLSISVKPDTMMGR